MISLTDYSRLASGKGWGPGWPTNRSADMQTVVCPVSGTRVHVHRRIAELVSLLLAETEARGYILVQAQTGAFNCRPIAGTHTPSNHSWGLALDLNWQRNPASYDGRVHTDFPAWLVPLWNSYGFAWGGNYTGRFKDAMHLEFMGGPDDADQMTALAKDRLNDASQAGPILEDDEVTDQDKADIAQLVWEKIAKGFSDPAHAKLNADWARALKALDDLKTQIANGGPVGGPSAVTIAKAVADETARRMQS